MCPSVITHPVCLVADEYSLVAVITYHLTSLTVTWCAFVVSDSLFQWFQIWKVDDEEDGGRPTVKLHHAKGYSGLELHTHTHTHTHRNISILLSHFCQSAFCENTTGQLTTTSIFLILYIYLYSFIYVLITVLLCKSSINYLNELLTINLLS